MLQGVALHSVCRWMGTVFDSTHNLVSFAYETVRTRLDVCLHCVVTARHLNRTNLLAHEDPSKRQWKETTASLPPELRAARDTGGWGATVESDDAWMVLDGLDASKNIHTWWSSLSCAFDHQCSSC